MNLIDTWWAIIRDGFNHIHLIQFVIIGLLFGWFSSSIPSAIFSAVFASVVYLAVDVLWPVIFNHAVFALPAFDTPFWHFFVSLTFAFLVVTLAVFILKSIFESIRG